MPPFAIVPSDGEGFIEERWEFQSALHDGFARREPRAHCFDSLVGQCSKLDRKSIEPMALQVEGGTLRGMQRLLSEVVWDEEQRRWNSQQLVAAELGEPEGVLLFDETGLVKKGQDAVGVARQQCGRLGKVEHGPVGVWAGEASRPGQALVDKRFCLPEAWLSDAQAARRTTCNVPPELTGQSQTPLAAALGHALPQEGLLPFQYGGADGLSGHSPDFVDAVDAWVGVTTCGAIPADTRCGLQAPRTAEQLDREKGEVRAKRGGVASDHVPGPVAAVAARLPASSWSRRQVSEGTKGPMGQACARQRVTLCKDGVPERTVWLVITRTVGAEPAYASSISHAPVSTPWRLFVWFSGLRWAIEIV